MTNERKNSSDKIQSKKDIVLKNNSGKKINAKFLIALVAIIAAGIVVFAISRNTQNNDARNGISQQSSQVQMANLSQNDSKELSYETSLFNDGKATFYQYPYGNILIKYFILKSTDGKIRAAFDACDVCWPEGKGYAQQGDEMICKNCGQRFPSVKINIVKGGCNPSPLHITVKDGKVVIKSSDIIMGSKYFDFTKKG